jgi:superfamily I DNA/RNA helicase
LDKIKIAYYQTFNDDTNPHFEYYFLPSNNMDYIFSNIIEIIIKLKLHPDDIGILSTKTETIRDLDFLIRSERNEETEMMCETKEESESFTEKGTDKIDIVRRNKKSNFWMNPGTIKLSTIHSFKGWEIHTLFLIIEEYPEKEGFFDKKISLDELIYTGITRCKYNLIIFNIENIRYDMFFKTIAQKW